MSVNELAFFMAEPQTVYSLRCSAHGNAGHEARRTGSLQRQARYAVPA